MKDQEIKKIKQVVVDSLRKEFSAYITSDITEEEKRNFFSSQAERHIERTVRRARIQLTSMQMKEVLKDVIAELVGLGPVEKFMEDPEISEIMVNGPGHVYVEKEGILHETEERFLDKTHLLNILDRIISPAGRRITEYEPFVDARLPDGSRVTIVIPPIALGGPYACIRKFHKKILSLEDLLNRETFSKEVFHFLKDIVGARMNVLISGATSTGKTTLLNALCSFVNPNQRMVVSEETSELFIEHKHCVRMEGRLPNIEGKGSITLKELTVLSLHLRPDRIIVGEVRGDECFYMLQALNTGHEGSMSTIHANSVYEALWRLESLMLMASPNISSAVARRMVIGAIDVVINLVRLSSGKRKIAEISYLDKSSRENYEIVPLFLLQERIKEDNRVDFIAEPTSQVLDYYKKLQHRVAIFEK